MALCDWEASFEGDVASFARSSGDSLWSATYHPAGGTWRNARFWHMTTARSPRRLKILVGSVVAIAGTCYTSAFVAVARAPLPPIPLLVGCVLLLSAGIYFHVSIRLGAQREELTWAEAAIVLSLAIVPGAWVVLLMPAAVLVRVGGRQPAIKTIYNVASYTSATAAAATVLTYARVSSPSAGARLLMLAAAGAVAGLVTYLAVAAVVATVQDVSLLATWRASGGLQILILGGNLAVAIGVLLLARYQPTAVALLPVIALCLHQGYVGRLRGIRSGRRGSGMPLRWGG
jgi:diguanylate cyclase